MFIDVPTEELRQGDICFEWPFPIWNLNSFQVLTQVGSGKAQGAAVNLLKGGDPLPIAICSHDCEVENSRSRSGLLIAPVLPWPYPDITVDKSLDLVGSRVPDAGKVYSYINLFPVNLSYNERDDWRVIDFSAMTAMAPPSKIKLRLLEAKRFEMHDKTRMEFKEKLAAFFGR